MNNLCCVLNTRVRCDACETKWCIACIRYLSDHLIASGYADIRVCDVTRKEVTYKIPIADNLTIWYPTKRYRR